MRFSLIIPIALTRNAPIIKSIRRLDYPESQFEALAVRGPNPSNNRNCGIAMAKGEIVVFLDDDAVIPPDYLKAAQTFFLQYPEVDIVGGPQLTAESDSDFSKISWYALSSMFGAWKMSTRYTVQKVRINVDETAVSSANLLCRRRVVETIKFDSSLFPGEDTNFIADAQKAGFTVACTPTIRLFHNRRPEIKGLLKQIYSYGKARARKETIRDTMRMPFFFVPSLFLIYLGCLVGFLCFYPLILSPASSIKVVIQEGIVTRSAIFYPLIAYIMLALGFGLYDGMRHRNYKAVLLLPFIYPAIHLSYGWGMIRGYWEKLF